MKTATTKYLVASRQLKTLAHQMLAKKSMPPADLRFYPVNQKTTNVLKLHLRVNAERAHNQCAAWAEEIIRIAEAIGGTNE